MRSAPSRSFSPPFAISARPCTSASSACPIRASFRALKNNAPWLIIFLSSLFFWIAFIARITTSPYFFEYVMHRPDLTSIANSLDVVSLGSIFFLPWLCSTLHQDPRLGCRPGPLRRRRRLVVGFGTGRLSVAIVLAGWVLGFLASGIAMAMPFSILSDSVDYGEWKNGVRAAGLLTAIGAAFCLKAGSGLGGALPAWILARIHYVPNVQQTPQRASSASTQLRLAARLAYALAALPVFFYHRYESMEPTSSANSKSAERLPPSSARRTNPPSCSSSNPTSPGGSHLPFSGASPSHPASSPTPSRASPSPPPNPFSTAPSRVVIAPPRNHTCTLSRRPRRHHPPRPRPHPRAQQNHRSPPLLHARTAKLLTEEPRRGGKWLTPKTLTRNIFDPAAAIEFAQSIDGARAAATNYTTVPDREAFEAKLEFCFAPTKPLFGLGSHEEGYANLRGRSRELYQQNMKAVVPHLVSTRGYSVLLDAGSLMTFHDDALGSYWWADAVDELDYYFIAGTDYDDVLSAAIAILPARLRCRPTGPSAIIQSKERYVTAAEMLCIVAEYRRRRIPLDVIVLDWKSWPNGGGWGQKSFDPTRFPDPAAFPANSTLSARS